MAFGVAFDSKEMNDFSCCRAILWDTTLSASQKHRFYGVKNYIPEHSKDGLGLCMGSTGSLLVSRCPVSFSSLYTSEPKAFWALPKPQACRYMCGLLWDRPPTKTNMPVSYGKIVSQIHVIHTMSLLRVLAAMRISKEKDNTDAWCCAGAG